MINRHLIEIKEKFDEVEGLMKDNDYLDKLDKALDFQCKELERLRNIIEELEKLIDSYELGKYDYEIPVSILKDKIKELKEK